MLQLLCVNSMEDILFLEERGLCGQGNLIVFLPGCSEPLGMKSGHIQDYQVTASSIFRTLNMDMFTWEPGKARLDKQGKVNAWTAGHSDQSQWLQVRCYLLLTPTFLLLLSITNQYGRKINNKPVKFLQMACFSLL